MMLEYRDAALLYGCIDDLKILKQGQVFIQTFNKEKQEWDIWINDKVLIYNEKHVHFSGDMIIMNCYKHDGTEKLAQVYKNVVGFPHPSVCAQVELQIFYQFGGGTLNGENQFVCIQNEKLMPAKGCDIINEYIEYPLIVMDDRCRMVFQDNPFKKVTDSRAMTKHEDDNNNNNKKKLRRDEIPLKNQSVCEQNVVRYAYHTLANDNIDYEILEYSWLAHADLYGADCQYCKEMSLEMYKAKKYHLLQMKLKNIWDYKRQIFPDWIQFNPSKKLDHEILSKTKINSESRSVMHYIKQLIDKLYKQYKLASTTLGYEVVMKSERDEDNNGNEEITKRHRKNGQEICDTDLMHELETRLAMDYQSEYDNNGYNDSNWKQLYNSEAFQSEIFDLKKAFEFDLFLRCKQYGVVNECELLTYKLLDLDSKQVSTMNYNEYRFLILKRKQFLCGRNESYSLQMVLSKMTHDMLYHYRCRLIYGLNNDNYNLENDMLYAKSLYIYHLIYKKNFEIVNCKQNYPFSSLLFAWILADYWMSIKINVKERNVNPIIDQIYIKQTLEINPKCKSSLYITPGFIGDSASDKQKVLQEHEEEVKMIDMSEIDGQSQPEQHRPVPDFVNIVLKYDIDQFQEQKDHLSEYKHNEIKQYDDDADDDNEQANGVDSGMIHNYADVEKFYKNNISDKYKNVDKTNYKNLTSLKFNPSNSSPHNEIRRNESEYSEFNDNYSRHRLREEIGSVHYQPYIKQQQQENNKNESNYDYQPRYHGYGHQLNVDNNSYDNQQYNPRIKNGIRYSDVSPHLWD